MLKTRFMQILILLLSLSSLACTNTPVNDNASGDERYGKQKVVYHINYDDPKKQAGGLKNIQNHINAVGAENLDIKVVLHGNGLALLLEPDSLGKLKKFKYANADEKMTARIDGLKDQGVSFNVCANTVRGRKVDLETDLYNVEKNDVVPSGVAEVARLQLLGYAYIKP
jgi:intracellular sulfur oxidation DsrE/DsrF family protein